MIPRDYRRRSLAKKARKAGLEPEGAVNESHTTSTTPQDLIEHTNVIQYILYLPQGTYTTTDLRLSNVSKGIQ